MIRGAAAENASQTAEKMLFLGAPLEWLVLSGPRATTGCEIGAAGSDPPGWETSNSVEETENGQDRHRSLSRRLSLGFLRPYDEDRLRLETRADRPLVEREDPGQVIRGRGRSRRNDGGRSRRTMPGSPELRTR